MSFSTTDQETAAILHQLRIMPLPELAKTMANALAAFATVAGGLEAARRLLPGSGSEVGTSGVGVGVGELGLVITEGMYVWLKLIVATPLIRYIFVLCCLVVGMFWSGFSLAELISLSAVPCSLSTSNHLSWSSNHVSFTHKTVSPHLPYHTTYLNLRI